MPRSFLITNKRYKADCPTGEEAAGAPLNVDDEVDDDGVDVDLEVEVEEVDVELISQPDDLSMRGKENRSNEATRPKFFPWKDIPSSRECSLMSELASSPTRPADRGPMTPDTPGSCSPSSPSPGKHSNLPPGHLGLHPGSIVTGTSLNMTYFPAAFFPPSPIFAHAPTDISIKGFTHDLSRLSHAAPPCLPTLSPHGATKNDLKELDNSLNDLVEKAWSEINMQDIHVCPECGKRYSTSSNLARHRQTHRSVNDKKARKCPHCEKVYVSMPAYSMHVRTHNQGCECPYCGKRFSRPWLLQGHIRTHTGEKPFTCPTCHKAFADKSNLRAHIQTHSSDKPYACERCGKAFALKSYLYKHEESSCMRGQRIQRAYERNH